MAINQIAPNSIIAKTPAKSNKKNARFDLFVETDIMYLYSPLLTVKNAVHSAVNSAVQQTVKRRSLILLRPLCRIFREDASDGIVGKPFADKSRMNPASLIDGHGGTPNPPRHKRPDCLNLCGLGLRGVAPGP